MLVPVNFPTVGADKWDSVYADQVIEQTKADGFRVVLERHSPGRNAEILTYLDERELVGVPVVSCDEPDTTPENLAAFCDGLILPQKCPIVEIGNEPLTNRKPPLTAHAYADLVNAAGAVLKAQGATVALAWDVARPNGWFHPRWRKWGADVMRLVTTDWDIAAVHPYRSGDPNVTWMRWPDWAHRCPWLGRRLFGEQERGHEIQAWKRLAGAQLAVTEVGWSRDRGSDAQIEQWLLDELNIQQQAGTEVVCVYAHHGPFGVLEDDRTLAPQGRAIRRFQRRLWARGA